MPTLLRTENRMRYRIWVLFDVFWTLWGNPRETKQQIISRWKKEVGNIDEYTRITGFCSQAEAAAAIVQEQTKDGK